jgi:serine/threonine protein kinase
VIEVEIKAKRYVCKCISKAIIEQFQLQSQLTNERELYDKLTDGFCPKVHCTFQNEDYIFIIMELLEGVNLDEYLEDQRPNLSAQNL